MVKLNYEGLKDKAAWEKAGFVTPQYDVEQVRANTAAAPTWLHIGAGNIFRGFICSLQQELLNNGDTDKGIVAVAPMDGYVLKHVMGDADYLTVQVQMHRDGTLDKEVYASLVDGLDLSLPEDYARTCEIFAMPSLQMLSFTVTEKGYSITDIQGNLTEQVKKDIANGPEHPANTMALVAGFLYRRFKAGKLPMTLASMDNFSHNGAKLKDSVVTVAKGWAENKLVEAEFVDYVSDESIVAFPWSCIDKITPRPDAKIGKMIEDSGIEGAASVVTEAGTYAANYVNAEVPQYLVVEDRFTNGRPPLEKAGVHLTDRETVDNFERMKVCTCLNPLHTSLAVFGCLLDFPSISSEMEDKSLNALVTRIGKVEGMPVVTDPGIVNPMDFLNEVLDERLPNPYLPDTPQRIATDTSQKLSIRFGETIKEYVASADLDLDNLVGIPLTHAAWLRYCLGVSDAGEPLALSADPMTPDMQKSLAGVTLGGDEAVARAACKSILNNKVIFGVDLYEVGLGERVEDYFVEMLAGPGAVKATLNKYFPA